MNGEAPTPIKREIPTPIKEKVQVMIRSTIKWLHLNYGSKKTIDLPKIKKKRRKVNLFKKK